MFQRLFHWIDAQTDRINPITVRDLRKLKRWYGLEISTLLALLSAVIAYTGVLIYFKPDDPEMVWDAWMKATVLLGIVGGLFLYIPCLVCFFAPVGWLTQSRQNDELLDLVPMSPKEHVWGYIQSTLILSVYCVSLGLPFFVAARMVGPIPDAVLLLPFLFPVVSLIGMLFILSFVIRVKKQWESVVIIIGMFYLGGLPIQLPIIGVIFLWTEVFGWPELYWNDGFGLISLFILLPLGLAALGCTAYRLSIYHFKHFRRSPWSGAVLNIAVYSILSLVLSAIYLGLADIWFSVF